MLTTPTILSGLITLTANTATLSPLQTTLPVRLPVTFRGVANLQIITGSFTPANDTQTIVSGLSAVSPNFIFFVCDGLANLSSDNGMLALLPVNKCTLLTLDDMSAGANPIDSLILDGTAANPYPMVQATALNYTIIVGQATIS